MKQLLTANPAVRQEVVDSAYNGAFADTKTWTDFLKQNLSGVGELSLEPGRQKQ